MPSGRYGLALRQVGRLLAGDSVATLGTGRLLERFAVDRDEAAFEALVDRHGPMVLGTCRRMLADPHDVDDAFQATFLVLARKAGSIQDADRLGPWLHGVARRVATRSRALSARRSAVERSDAEDQAIEPPAALEAFELRAVLDEELSRLPEKYRVPLVLCYLEGLTHDEAARQLHWPVGTVRSRLAGGRDRLRARLTRRGLAPSGIVPAPWPHASIPQALLTATVRVATTAGSAPAHVANLAKGALVAMVWNKLKMIAALGLMAALTVGGAGVAAHQDGASKGTVKDKASSTEIRTAENSDGIVSIEQYRAWRQKLLELDLRLIALEAKHELAVHSKQPDDEEASRKIAELTDELARLMKEREELIEKIKGMRIRTRDTSAKAPAPREMLPPPNQRDELAKLQGSWRHKWTLKSRRQFPGLVPPESRDLLWTIEGKVLVAVERGEGPTTDELPSIFTADIGVVPDAGRSVVKRGRGTTTGELLLGRQDGKKTLDIIQVEKDGSRSIQRGLYALDGDALAICVGAPNAPRPASFDSDRESEPSPAHYTLVFERQPEKERAKAEDTDERIKQSRKQIAVLLGERERLKKELESANRTTEEIKFRIDQIEVRWKTLVAQDDVNPAPAKDERPKMEAIPQELKVDATPVPGTPGAEPAPASSAGPRSVKARQEVDSARKPSPPPMSCNWMRLPSW